MLEESYSLSEKSNNKKLCDKRICGSSQGFPAAGASADDAGAVGGNKN